MAPSISYCHNAHISFAQNDLTIPVAPIIKFPFCFILSMDCILNYLYYPCYAPLRNLVSLHPRHYVSVFILRDCDHTLKLLGYRPIYIIEYIPSSIGCLFDPHVLICYTIFFPFFKFVLITLHILPTLVLSFK